MKSNKHEVWKILGSTSSYRSNICTQITLTYLNKCIIANFGGPCFAANDKSETQWNADVVMSSLI